MRRVKSQESEEGPYFAIREMTEEKKLSSSSMINPPVRTRDINYNLEIFWYTDYRKRGPVVPVQMGSFMKIEKSSLMIITFIGAL